MFTKDKKRLIGRQETVDFPDLGVFGVPAKIDTGAYSTALHCADIKVIVKDGVEMLCFKPLDESQKEYCTASFLKKDIKNSFGESESRYVIKTRIRIAKTTIKSVISLTDRGQMRLPVLIGRKVLKRRFIVDVEFENLWINK
jgi:hypothetical protein